MKTLLAFDFGLRRIGVAVGNTLIQQAQPLKVISITDNNNKFAEFGKLIMDWTPERCIIGFPMYPDGTIHKMSMQCRCFGNQLRVRFGVNITLVDERYSSAVISSRRGKLIDAIAAAIILQQYFDDIDQSD